MVMTFVHFVATMPCHVTTSPSQQRLAWPCVLAVVTGGKPGCARWSCGSEAMHSYDCVRNVGPEDEPYLVGSLAIVQLTASHLLMVVEC